jgi:zinc/manganese transport system substrate-binding protein
MPEVPSVKPLDARLALATGVACVVLALSACAPAPRGASGASPATGASIRVVAAENFWGSIATQLGGDKVQVTSIIANPNTDPHDYEPTVADARNLAKAGLVLYNGVGYDPWVQRLLGANPSDTRVELNVGDIVGVPAGGNPHRWYSPSDVHEVVASITAGYKRLDPANAAYYDEQRTRYETQSLVMYDAIAADIASNYAGTPVGASESIVTPLTDALKLNVITPPTLLTAVSEGVDPSAADKATVDTQIRTHQLKLFIYNEQNSTPDVMSLVSAAKAAGIPVITVTETLSPADELFQDWQVRQMQAIEAALRRTTGK